MNKLNNEIQSYRRMIDVLDQCIDDYLFVLDIENDSCYISPHAEVRFKMENHEFKNPIEKFKEFIYYKDYDLVMEDLDLIFTGKKNFIICNIVGWVKQEKRFGSIVVGVLFMMKIIRLNI